MSAFANLKWAYGKCVEEINKRPSTDMTAPSGYIILDNGKKAQVQVTVTTNVDDFIPSPDDEKSFNNHLQKQILEQQPIPQDINKWIEDEKNDFYNRFTIPKVADGVKIGFEKCAQLLLPRLQQLRDKVWALEGVAKDQESEIEQQKETIDELKAKLEHYRNETSKVQKFVYERKDIGLPCQPIFDAIKDFINEQAAEIESLKQENEKLVRFNQDVIIEGNLWKQRCMAAEYLISPNADIHRSYFEKWKNLKELTKP